MAAGAAGPAPGGDGEEEQQQQQQPVIKSWFCVTDVKALDQPSASGNVLANLPKRKVVTELERRGDWIRTHTGWARITEGLKEVLHFWAVAEDGVYGRPQPQDNADPSSHLLHPGLRFAELERGGDWVRGRWGWVRTAALRPLGYADANVQDVLQARAERAANRSPVVVKWVWPPPGYQPPTVTTYEKFAATKDDNS
eukprot:TRINITY_DN5780_c0_g1_i2.p1 TRINITY_DN5780_c0_g1~~TRINITY_DN5780_c0_g1_i2.p1  ORF type:complete len:197 (+),score=55.31 TRINITY_DN5780_c0_g1_i2:143-733(+)